MPARRRATALFSRAARDRFFFLLRSLALTWPLYIVLPLLNIIPAVVCNVFLNDDLSPQATYASKRTAAAGRRGKERGSSAAVTPNAETARPDAFRRFVVCGVCMQLPRAGRLFHSLGLHLHEQVHVRNHRALRLSCERIRGGEFFLRKTLGEGVPLRLSRRRSLFAGVCCWGGIQRLQRPEKKDSTDGMCQASNAVELLQELAKRTLQLVQEVKFSRQEVRRDASRGEILEALGISLFVFSRRVAWQSKIPTTPERPFSTNSKKPWLSENENENENVCCCCEG